MSAQRPGDGAKTRRFQRRIEARRNRKPLVLVTFGDSPAAGATAAGSTTTNSRREQEKA